MLDTSDSLEGGWKMNEIEFLKEMVKDLDRHKEVIQKRIREFEGDTKEPQKIVKEEVKKEPSKFVEKAKRILGNVADGIGKTYK